MIMWKAIERKDIHRGTIGYVEFLLDARKVMIPCEVIGIKERIEIVPISGERICLWIDYGQLLTKHEGV